MGHKSMLVGHVMATPLGRGVDFDGGVDEGVPTIAWPKVHGEGDTKIPCPARGKWCSCCELNNCML